MVDFEQEWISPILEVYKKDTEIEEVSIVLGLNPIGQSICRRLYEHNTFETVLVFNSPSFSTWTRYPTEMKPPVIPVQAMISGDLMLIFGDVIVKEYEWVTDMLFYLRGEVPTRFVIALLAHDAATCGQVMSSKGNRLLKRIAVPLGKSDFYDGLVAPLLSIGPVAGLDPVVLFLERSDDTDPVLQVDDITVYHGDVEKGLGLLDKGLDLNMSGVPGHGSETG
ncbi:MAG: hypothetical protein ACW985_13295 [Candidatus Thorarchaeota archaeon]|jgi:hypothetical protein